MTLSSAKRWFGQHWLFVLIALTYAYFFQGTDPNQTTRTLLAKALVERHAPDITPDATRTIDKGFSRGKYYSDKAPGVAALATIPYALMKAADRIFHLERGSRAVERARLHMLTITTSGIAGAVAAYFVFRILLLFGLSRGQAELLTVGYALGTLVFPFSTVMFGHQTAAAVLVGTFYLLLRMKDDPGPIRPARAALVGALLASSIVIEYPTGLLVGPIALYALSLSKSRREGVRFAMWAALGAALPLTLHSLFLYWSYGAPLALPYKFVSEPVFVAHVSKGLLGIGVPTRIGAYGVLLSRYRGLFYYCPLLILAPLGFSAWIRAGDHRREALLCASLIIVYLLFCTSYYAWDGGGSTGPRHLVPVIAFFVFPIGFYLRGSRFGLPFTVAALVPSIVIMAACVACIVQLPEGDPETFDPLYEFVFPSLRRGHLAQNMQDMTFAPIARADASYNMGQLFHLSPAMSLMIPVLVWCLAFVPRWRQRFSAVNA